jgi:hypothetical protein
VQAGRIGIAAVLPNAFNLLAVTVTSSGRAEHRGDHRGVRTPNPLVCKHRWQPVGSTRPDEFAAGVMAHAGSGTLRPGSLRALRQSVRGRVRVAAAVPQWPSRRQRRLPLHQCQCHTFGQRNGNAVRRARIRFLCVLCGLRPHGCVEPGPDQDDSDTVGTRGTGGRRRRAKRSTDNTRRTEKEQKCNKEIDSTPHYTLPQLPVRSLFCLRQRIAPSPLFCA